MTDKSKLRELINKRTASPVQMLDDLKKVLIKRMDKTISEKFATLEDEIKKTVETMLDKHIKDIAQQKNGRAENNDTF